MEEIDECRRCGKMWDADGCRISISAECEYIVNYFICENCKTPTTKEEEGGR